MNVFLDTNIILKDPYFKHNQNTLLLDLAKSEKIKLFISTVVLQEVEKNIKTKFESLVTDYNKTRKDLLHNGFEAISEIEDVEKALHYYNKFTEGLIKNKSLIVVDLYNGIFDETLQRSLNYIMPFSKGKESFKDTLIWLSYVRKAKDEGLNDCILLSANSSDFCDASKKKLHPDLLNDSPVFTIYNSSNELFSERKDFAALGGEDKYYDYAFVDDKLRTEFMTTFVDLLNTRLYFEESYKLFSTFGSFNGSIIVRKISDYYSTNIQNNKFTNGEVLVSAEVYLTATTDFLEKIGTQSDFKLINELKKSTESFDVTYSPAEYIFSEETNKTFYMIVGISFYVSGDKAYGFEIENIRLSLQRHGERVQRNKR